MVVTRRGLVLVPLAAALALAGVAYGVEEFVLVAVSAAAALAVASVVVAFASVRARRALRIVLVAPWGALHVGMPAQVTLQLSNAGTRPLTGLRLAGAGQWDVTLPGLPGTGKPVPAAAAVAAPRDGARPFRRVADALGAAVRVELTAPVPMLRPDARWTTGMPLAAERRGLWSLRPTAVWCVDPLGLVARRVAVAPALHVVVCPVPRAAMARTRALAPTGAGALQEASGTSPTAGVAGDEFAGLRPYVPGDRLTRLHWPALARGGDPLVREFVEADAARVEVVVDDRPHAVEEAVVAAATAGVGALEEGAVVELVTSAGSLRVPPGPDARGALLEALALVAPGGWPA